MSKTLWAIKETKLTGAGVFALENIPAGVVIGRAFERVADTGDAEDDYRRTMLGEMVGHDERPNLIVEENGHQDSLVYYFTTSTAVRKGDELTIDYSLFPWENKRSFASSMVRPIARKKT